MQLPINLDRNGRRSLQFQVFDQLRDMILGGRLPPGTPLPPTRNLAQQLDVSRNTVMLAYDRLTVEGYIQTRAAVGTYVSFDLPEDQLTTRDGAAGTAKGGGDAVADGGARRHPVLFKGRAHGVPVRERPPLDVDFWVGRPDPHSFPVTTWRRLTARHLSRAESAITDYGDPLGLLALREAVVGHLGPARGMDVDPGQVVIVSGMQEAMNVIARLFIGPGTPAVIECPGYQGAAFVLESYGAEIIGIPVDHEGIETAKLPERPVAVAYVTPSHQYPLGVTLSLERRLRLLDWARRTGAYVVEDDYDSDFRYQGSPLTALRGLDGDDCVIYVGTFSKSIGAGLRVGYMVVPPALVDQVRTVKALLDNGHAHLIQAVLADFIKDGGYASHLRRIRRLYMGRRDRVVEGLRRHFGAVKLTGLRGGMHLAWHLPPDLPDAATVHRIGIENRVGIYSLEAGAAVSYCDCNPTDRVMMIGYSSTDERQIDEGLSRLAKALGRA